MTDQEKAELEQAAKPQRWGSKERMALVAEVLRQKRIVRWLCYRLSDFYDDSKKATPDYWLRKAEHAVTKEISPKE